METISTGGDERPQDMPATGGSQGAPPQTSGEDQAPPPTAGRRAYVRSTKGGAGSTAGATPKKASRPSATSRRRPAGKKPDRERY